MSSPFAINNIRNDMKSTFLNMTRFVANRCNSRLVRLIAPHESRLKTHSSRRLTADFRIILLFSFFISAAWAEETVYTVPGEEYSTIEEALEAIGEKEFVAENSYVIEVEPGIYSLNIAIPTDNITLRGKVTSRTFLKSDNDSADVINPIIDIDFVNNIKIENFTFINSDLAIQINNIQENLDIQFNVFNMGAENTAISFINNSPVSIENNTFYDNQNAIDSLNLTVLINHNLLSITNNIFAKNDLAITTQVSEANISYSCLFDNTNNGALGFSSTIGAPLFVNAPENSDDDIYDFHLRADSACIDVGDINGSGDSITGDDADDAGAFGGATLDKHPYPALNVTAGDVTTTNADVVTYNITLSWDANESYVMQKDVDTVGSYKIYYANQNFTREEVTTNQVASQVEVTTSTTLTDIASTVVNPSPPAGISTTISNQLISVAWDSVENATGYYVYYGINSTTENKSALLTETSYDIEGVLNNQTYRIAVSAATQETLYYAVSVIDAYANESYFEDDLIQRSILSGELESELSDIVLAIPEQLVAYPELPNKSCFLENLEVYSSTDLDNMRTYRDNVLKTNLVGQLLVDLYYLVSPMMVSLVEQSTMLKEFFVSTAIMTLPLVIMQEIYLVVVFLWMFFLAAIITCVPLYRLASR